MAILSDRNERVWRRWCRTLNVCALAAGMFVLLWRTPYAAAVIVAGLVPVVALWMIWLSGGVVTLVNSKTSSRPTVLAAFVAPAWMLLVRAIFAWRLLDWKNVWSPFGMFSVGMATLMFLLGRRALDSFAKVPGLLLCCAAWGYGMTVNLNCTLDAAPATTYNVRVVHKNLSRGKRTSYHLTLAPWGPSPEMSVDVTQELFNKYPVGSSATVVLHPGAFGIPFYKVQ